MHDGRDATSRNPSASWLATGLTVLSGFASLGYEIIWTEQLGLALGLEQVALLAVLGAFFGGLALGAQLFARVIEQSARPARWYAACEAAVGGWALALSFLLPRAAAVLAQLTGPEPSPLQHFAVAFLGTGALLLPATLPLGAALPALARAQRGLGSLYAANTFGAVLGVLGSAFVLVPSLGLAASTRCCALLSLGCAALSWLAYRKQYVAPPPVTRTAVVPLALFATGFLGIGYEVIAVRALAQVSENTVYTFALLLAIYLLGTAAGSAVQRRWPRGQRLLPWAAGITSLAGGLSLWLAGPLARGISSHGSLAAEAAVGVIAFLPVTLVLGALFTELCEDAPSLSHAFAANTLGAALAPAAIGFWLLPSFGLPPLVLTLALGYVLLARPTRKIVLPLLAATVLAGYLLPPFVAVDIPPGGKLLHHREGRSATVSVVEDGRGVKTLRIDNREQEGSDATVLADARQAWLPLLLHPQPARALFLGLGTGVTAGAAAWSGTLQVAAVELLPEVREAAAYFQPALRSSQLPTVVISDARRYVRARGPQYDVIVADLFHPARRGSGALYTVEHFAAVRGRLAPAGLFCQWLPLHQLDLATLRSIVRSFRAVFPEASALLATNSLDTPVLGLIAQREPHGYALAPLQARVAALKEPARLPALHLDDAWSVLGSFIAGPSALRRFSADAPLNTDDQPIVAHRAPLATYAHDSNARERLLELLDALDVQPSDVLTPPDRAQHAARLAAYWSARDRFLELGTRVRPSSDASVMLAQLGAPLLDVLRASPDFRPAYEPLLRMAEAVSAHDAPQASRWLTQLTAAQPERPEAAQLLRRVLAQRP